ncbi:MAG TPA: DUF3568 family protein [Nitrospirae bacterium]|nr:DUF3568 family protein [Nitrospirota bacterium]
MRKIVRITVLLLSLTLLWSCEVALIGIGAGVGVGAYKYIEGNLERDYPFAFNLAWDATNTSLENLQMSVSNSINEGTKGKIEAVRRDGSNVTIRLSDRSQGVTRISVRVGFFGDRDEARRLHEEIFRTAGLE